MLNARIAARWALLGGLLLVASVWIGHGIWRPRGGRSPEVLHLADGTIASLGADTRLVPAAGFPGRRELSLDGEALMKVPAMGRPLIIRTRLMRLAALGASTLAITARSRETGEEVEVLDGEAIVSKNYPSSYRVPDHLHGGEMSMVNVTIDLMEKEPMDAAAIAAIRRRVSGLK